MQPADSLRSRLLQALGIEMAFRRYGGDFSSRGDSGNQRIAFFGLILLVLCIFASLIFANPGLVIAGFILLFIFLCLSTIFGSGKSENIRKVRHSKHLEDAKKYYADGNYELSKESFRKAEIYGDVPASHKEIFERVQKSK